MAVDAVAGDEAVTAETWLWKDLSIAGDDWDVLIFNALEELGLEATSEINI